MLDARIARGCIRTSPGGPRARPARMQCPTLVIHGIDDEYGSPKHPGRSPERRRRRPPRIMPATRHVPTGRRRRWSAAISWRHGPTLPKESGRPVAQCASNTVAAGSPACRHVRCSSPRPGRTCLRLVGRHRRRPPPAPAKHDLLASSYWWNRGHVETSSSRRSCSRCFITTGVGLSARRPAGAGSPRRYLGVLVGHGPTWAWRALEDRVADRCTPGVFTGLR